MYSDSHLAAFPRLHYRASRIRWLPLGLTIITSAFLSSLQSPIFIGLLPKYSSHSPIHSRFSNYFCCRQQPPSVSPGLVQLSSQRPAHPTMSRWLPPPQFQERCYLKMNMHPFSRLRCVRPIPACSTRAIWPGSFSHWNTSSRAVNPPPLLLGILLCLVKEKNICYFCFVSMFALFLLLHVYLQVDFWYAR